MNLVTIEVEIDHGKVTPVGSQALPDRGHVFLTVLPSGHASGTATFSVENESDGLPVIRTQTGVITSQMVREIEGFSE
jgi:hypothetical protein